MLTCSLNFLLHGSGCWGIFGSSSGSGDSERLRIGKIFLDLHRNFVRDITFELHTNTHLLDTLEAVVGGKTNSKEVLVRIDQRVDNGDDGRIVEGQ